MPQKFDKLAFEVDHIIAQKHWNGALLVGRTPIGRATIEVLEINLPDRTALRQALMDEGVYHRN
jgi:hypothetical protein